MRVDMILQPGEEAPTTTSSVLEGEWTQTIHPNNLQ
jgi:hypothetical protein